MKFTRSDAYRAAVHQKIPGGAHTYSKGDDQFPERAPAAIVRGSGSHVWDLDGNEFIDCSMALGAVSLGHAYPSVVKAAQEQIALGVNFQRPAAIELEYAEAFLKIAPGAERIKYGKNGSTLTSAAVRLARAYTGRDLVAFPGNHAFYSYDDWFIGSTAANAGVPDAVRKLSVTYNSYDPATLEHLFKTYPDAIAAVISEPTEVLPASPDAIQEVAKIARRHGALFISDEMVTGYRMGWPGGYPELGLEPDLVTWGKAIGNGFSFCALTGRADVMDLGGIKQAERPRVFLVSTTHGGEAHGIAAALAVLREYQAHDVIGHHRRMATAVAEGWRAASAAHGLQQHLEVHALPWRVVVLCRDAEGNISVPLRTLLLQEMIARGILFQGIFLPCFSHTDDDVKKIVAAFDASCAVYKEALTSGWQGLLHGEATRPVFRKYNGCRQTCPSQPCPHESTCRSNT